MLTALRQTCSSSACLVIAKRRARTAPPLALTPVPAQLFPTLGDDCSAAALHVAARLLALLRPFPQDLENQLAQLNVAQSGFNLSVVARSLVSEST